MLDDLFQLLTRNEQDGLLEGYVEAHSDGQRRVPKDEYERAWARDAMLDNAADCAEIRRDHVGYCLKCLVSAQ